VALSVTLDIFHRKFVFLLVEFIFSKKSYQYSLITALLQDTLLSHEPLLVCATWCRGIHKWKDQISAVSLLVFWQHL